MQIKLIYDNPNDKEFFINIDYVNTDSKKPLFVDFIDINSMRKKEGWKLLNYYGAKVLPFVELEDDKRIPFYGEKGNAINQLMKYLNDRRSVQET